MKKECANCRYWRKPIQSRCKENGSVTQCNATCKEWNLKKVERVFASSKEISGTFRNGKVHVKLSHWTGTGETLYEALEKIEEKL